MASHKKRAAFEREFKRPVQSATSVNRAIKSTDDHMTHLAAMGCSSASSISLMLVVRSSSFLSELSGVHLIVLEVGNTRFKLPVSEDAIQVLHVGEN